MVSPARILVVEDEALIQMVICAYLEELEFEVEVAGTAAEAKRKLELLNGEFRAAIIDIGLPDAKGDDLLRALRSAYPELPVLIASGYGDAALQERFGHEPALGVLNKPYTIDQLRDALFDVGVAS